MMETEPVEKQEVGIGLVNMRRRNLSIAVALLLLTACVNTRVMTQEGAPAKHKLPMARVVWDDKAKVTFNVSKPVQAGSEAIADSDRQVAQQVLRSLLDELATTVPAQVRDILRSNGLRVGEGAVVRLSPVKASHVIGGGRSALVRVMITDSEGVWERWSVTLSVTGSKTDSDQELARQLAVAVGEELKAAGWI